MHLLSKGQPACGARSSLTTTIVTEVECGNCFRTKAFKATLDQLHASLGYTERSLIQALALVLNCEPTEAGRQAAGRQVPAEQLNLAVTILRSWYEKG